MTRKSKIPQELLDEMTPAVRAFVEALLAENTALRKRVEQLEHRLGMNSGYSSLPPIERWSRPAAAAAAAGVDELLQG